MPKAEAVEYQVGDRTVKLSSPDRVMFTERGFTKRDVFEYYLAVQEPMLRYIAGRPTALQRFPDGIDGEMFYQKRIPAKGVPEWMNTAEITFPSRRKADELCPLEAAHILWAVQMNGLVFHPWPVRAPEVDNPDELRIDLDPQPGTDFADAASIATEVVREVLADAGLVGFPKTSGGRGVHIYIRIRPDWSFIDARRAVIALARELERRDPARVTTSWWKEERGERVFVDFNQMARDRTIASPYSLRANQRATVSTPVTWAELSEVEPNDFDLKTVPERLASKGDAYATLDDQAYGLETLLEWWAKDPREMNWPPDYPKMPGEPPRVQPSKKVAANWE
jgi:DNA ligase D